MLKSHANKPPVMSQRAAAASPWLEQQQRPSPPARRGPSPYGLAEDATKAELLLFFFFFALGVKSCVASVKQPKGSEWLLW